MNTHILTQQPKNTNNVLAFKPKRKLPLHRLPFVGNSSGAKNISYWDVPRTGGFFGGCRTGSAIALLYLNHVKQHQLNDSGGVCLQHIVMDMMGLDYGVSDEIDSVRGQVAGFFAEIEKCVLYAESCGYTTGNASGADLLREANEGLAQGDEFAIQSSLQH